MTAAHQQLVLPFVKGARLHQRADGPRPPRSGNKAPPVGLWARASAWDQAQASVRHAGRRLQRELAMPAMRPDLEALIGGLERALAEERIAWCELVPDVAAVRVPSRLSDRESGRPAGLVYDPHTMEVRATGGKKGESSVLGTVRRTTAGAYEGKLQLRITGSALVPVLERVRICVELAG